MKSPLFYGLSSSPKKFRNQSLRAFTLMELMVVMAVMGVMIGTVSPSLSGILRGQAITSGVDTVSGVLEMARSEAIAKKTYVWVGVSGSGTQFQIAAVRSLDATSDLTAGNFAPIGKVQKIDNFKMVAQTDLGMPMQTKVNTVLAGESSVDVGAIPSTLPAFTVGGQTFSNFVVFTSEGEALVTSPSESMSFPRNIFIGLRGMRGDQKVAADVNNSAILLDGGSGRQQVIRL